MAFRGAEGEVLVRMLPRDAADQRRVLLLQAGPGGMTPAALRGLGLTARQAQVLRWVSLGRSPSAAAAEMGIARRTVDKHLQNVFAKLGATTLAEATASAWAAIGIERSPVG